VAGNQIEIERATQWTAWLANAAGRNDR
jgi:hypothetical protein